MRITAWVSTHGKPIDTASEIAALQRIESETGVRIPHYVDRPLGDLPGVLAASRPDVFHFIGHGNQAGDLVMSDFLGMAHLVAATDLAAILRAPDGGGVEGVVLNACHSGRAAHALAPRGGWVVAMDATIRDDAAIEFTSAFYGSLVAGQTPGAASRAARAHLSAAGYSGKDHLARLLPGTGYGYYKSRAPRDDDRNRDAMEHVATVFNRSAFRTPAIQEASYSQLSEALDHTALALGTGQMVMRTHPTAPFSTIPPSVLGAPALRVLGSTVLPLLDQARGVLVRLDAAARESGPTTPTYDFTYRTLVQAKRIAEAQSLLGLMDEMDSIRNRIMRAVNRALMDHGVPPLPPIQKSSDQVALFGP